MRVRRSPEGLQATYRKQGNPWSEPETIVGTRGVARFFNYALGPDGVAVVTYTAGLNANQLWVQRRARGTWSEPHQLGRGDPAAPVVDGRGTVSVAWLDNRASCPGHCRDIWVRTTSSHPRQGWLPVRSFRASWGYTPAIASGLRGDSVLAWGHRSGVAVVSKRHGRGWGSVTRIPSDTGSAGYIDAAVDRRGRAVVLWGRDSELESYKRRYVAAANTMRGGTWTPPTYLNRPTEGGVAYGLDLSMAPSGRTFAAWVGPNRTDTASFTFRSGWQEWRPAH